MAHFLSVQPQSLLVSPTTTINPTTRADNHNLHFGFSNNKPFFSHRGSVGVVRFAFRPPPSLSDLDGMQGLVHEVFTRTEGLLYTLADAAVSASSSETTVVEGAAKESGDWLSGISNLMETVLKVLKDGLSTLHVSYAYGFAIILLTVLVKAATFPLTKKQVESAMAMRSLQPQVQAIQKQYAGDQERIQLETARLYKLAGVNPFAGCLPTLATIPVWIGLYRALSNVANEGLLTEGFFWIPSLAGPTTIAARQNGSGISWIFPFVDGHPPLGWPDTLAYLVLPLLLVVSQYLSIQIMQSSQANDPNMKSSQALSKFLPLMIGYFALSVPSGLSLYWFTNNILSTTQQVWLQKLGGAKNQVRQFSNNPVKEVQQKLEISGTDVNFTEVTPSRKEEKSSSGGPPPGERFRQLKEQEARRRQQREEEKMKLEAKGSEMTYEEQKEVKLVEKSDGKTEGDVIVVQDDIVQSKSMYHSSGNTVLNVNGGYLAQVSDADQSKMPGLSKDTGDMTKEEAVEIYNTTIVNTDTAAVSGENKNNRVEQQKEDGD